MARFRYRQHASQHVGDLIQCRYRRDVAGFFRHLGRELTLTFNPTEEYSPIEPVLSLSQDRFHSNLL